MAAFFGFGATAEIDLRLRDEESRPKVKLAKHPHQSSGQALEELFLFDRNDTVAGTVSVDLKNGSKLEHLGIKVELIGQIELASDRGNHFVFTSLMRDLDQAGTLTGPKEYPFEFLDVDKQYESYNGLNVRLRYFLRVRITRSYAPNIAKEFEFAVQLPQAPPEPNTVLKMEVGIEECLHIEFEYDKSKYHLDDVIIGKIFFLLVRIKIRHMELQILRRETCGQAQSMFNETDVITKFEIMDGAPVRGEKIPIRLFLSPFQLTPTMNKVHSKFSVRYYINLVLVDEEDRRYFKQQEIILWRGKGDEVDAPHRVKTVVPLGENTELA